MPGRTCLPSPPRTGSLACWDSPPCTHQLRRSGENPPSTSNFHLSGRPGTGEPLQVRGGGHHRIVAKRRAENQGASAGAGGLLTSVRGGCRCHSVSVAVCQFQDILALEKLIFPPTMCFGKASQSPEPSCQAPYSNHSSPWEHPHSPTLTWHTVTPACA